MSLLEEAAALAVDRRVHGRRPRRDRVPGRRRPLLGVEDRRGDRPLRRGAGARGRRGRLRRSPALGHLPLARALPSAEPRLGRGCRTTSSARSSSPRRARTMRRAADALFQASLVAHAQGRWVLARTYAERARALFDALGDRATVARLLNNLAGSSHLLGDDDRAVALLEEAFGIFVDLDLAGRRGLRLLVARGDPAGERRRPRRARRRRGRRSTSSAIASTTCRRSGRRSSRSAGRSPPRAGSMKPRTWIAAADETFEQARSMGHRSSAWIAQGDVESLRGDDRVAAGLYRRAALALREDVAHTTGRRRPPATRVAGDRRAFERVVASCRRTSPRRGRRGGRRAPSARRRGSAYFPW